ncbi:CILP1-like protein [Mya arenaria]|uniref:CILP1-like protein n=1 Tax=Mya arenaria TaxID=6604 RepID=A0ABY7DWL3_MYAAR|nr:CILP1-like protein [Mya arenaria]
MSKNQFHDVYAYARESSQSSNYYENNKFGTCQPDMVANVKHRPRQNEDSLTTVKSSKSPHFNKLIVAVIVSGVLITGAIVAVTVKVSKVMAIRTQNISKEQQNQRLQQHQSHHQRLQRQPRQPQIRLFMGSGPRGLDGEIVNKLVEEVLRFARERVRNRTVMTWTARVCTSGTLSQDCTICECSNIIEGRVIVNSSGDPISNANIYSASAPTNLLTTSDSIGFFTLNTTCDDSEVYVTREGFQDVTTVLSTTNTDVVMDVEVLPYLIQEPKPRQRLIGENFTLCCLATGKPPISYYEWFRDSLFLDPSLYPDGRELSLQNLESMDSGVYTCRANSPVGSVMSPEAKLTSLTNSAAYEVGDCVATKCRGYNDLNSDLKCGKDAVSCCTVGEMKFETVQCSDYELQVLVVKSCVCGYCATSSLKITGTVLSFDDNEAIKYSEIYVNNNYETFTNSLGNFYLTLSEQTDRVTISVYDNFIQQYLPAVNGYYFTEDMHGSLSVTIQMVKKPHPIYLDSTTPNSLTGTPSVELALPANSFYYPNGTQFNGTVSALFKYFNPTNDSDLDTMPGEFRYVDEEGQTGELDSLGIFSLEFNDESGNNVIVNKVIDVYIPSELEANESGGWDVLSTGTSQRRRKKRGWSPILVGEIDSSRLRSKFINIDRRRRRSDTCYVKSRIYKEPDFLENEIDTKRYATIQTNIVEGSVLLRFYDGFRYPESFCHTTLCPDLDGYVAIKYFEQSGYEYLFAGKPLVSSSNLNYSILNGFTKDVSVLKIRHKSTTSGPFYDDLKTCEASNINQSHLRFFHKELDKVFITNPIYNPPQPIKPDLKHIELSQLTWYPKDSGGEGYAACFFKIRIEFDSTGSVSESMKLQLKSIAGTRDSIQGKLYGITQRRIGREKRSQSICLEYKCSGVNDPIYEPGVDYTKVNVKFSYPVSETTCQISQESSSLVSSTSPGGNTAQVGNQGGSYEFLAPSDTHMGMGLYRITSDDLDLNKAQKNALQECRAGAKNSDDTDELAGVGITISCTLNESLCETTDSVTLAPGGISIKPIFGPLLETCIKNGSRVVRGENWIWNDQDLNGRGTVDAVGFWDEEYMFPWVEVTWDLDNHTNYYRNGNGKYDLYIIIE